MKRIKVKFEEKYKMKELYNSKDYKKIYQEMLKSFSDSNCRTSKEHVLFFPQVGKNYFSAKTKILFMGVATNKWGEECFKPNDLKKDNFINALVECAIDYSKPEKTGECSMKWISDNWDIGYQMNKKPFWRIIKGATDKIFQNKKYFHENIAWSQFYKIAPYAGGNPNGKIAELQNGGDWSKSKKNRAFSYELLEKEIEILKPDYTFLIVGKNWKHDYFDYPEYGYQYKPIKSKKYIRATLEINNYASSILITSRPDEIFKGKKEKDFVDEIVQTIKLKICTKLLK